MAPKTEDKQIEAKDADPKNQIAINPTSTSVANFNDDDFFGIQTGMEDVTSADVTLPRYTILQGLSPQVNSRKDEYVEGAKMGMIFNTASGKVMDSQRLVFAYYQRRHIEWTPRDKPCPIEGLPKPVGGGLFKDYGTDDSIVGECKIWEENNSLWTPRGNELVITGTWYVVDPDTLATGWIGMGKTQFTSSKKLLAGIRDEKYMHPTKGIQPAPMFYRVWEMSTRLREFDGNEWFVWQHKPAERIQELPQGRAILDACKEISRTIQEGDMTVDVTIGETDGQAGRNSGGNVDSGGRM
jgi:hypothetical protein